LGKWYGGSTVGGPIAYTTYAFEMTEGQHAELLDTIVPAPGYFLVSGYDHPLYNAHLGRWRRVEITVNENTSHAKVCGTKTEVLWMNYLPDGERIPSV
jgi:DNA adenine methylase